MAAMYILVIGIHNSICIAEKVLQSRPQLPHGLCDAGALHRPQQFNKSPAVCVAMPC